MAARSKVPMAQIRPRNSAVKADDPPIRAWSARSGKRRLHEDGEVEVAPGGLRQRQVARRPRGPVGGFGIVAIRGQMFMRGQHSSG
jgi:hypothetical protein